MDLLTYQKTTKFRKLKSLIIKPIVKVLVKTGISANMLTIIGLVCGIISFFFMFNDHFWFVVFLLLQTVFDILDGDVARATGKQDKFGYFLDKTADNICALLLIIKPYFYMDEPLALYAFVIYLGHLFLAGKSWDSFFIPGSTIMRVLFIFKFYKIGIIFQLIQSPIKLIAYHVTRFFSSKKLNTAK